MGSVGDGFKILHCKINGWGYWQDKYHTIYGLNLPKCDESYWAIHYDMNEHSFYPKTLFLIWCLNR